MAAKVYAFTYLFGFNIFFLFSLSINCKAYQNITTITIEQSNITVDGQTFYHWKTLSGTGPCWKIMNGIGTLVIPVGEEINILYQNNLFIPSIIHIHGQRPPSNLDGAPFISAPPIEPQRSTIVRFLPPNGNRGDYFMHSHYSFQSDDGVAAPVIIKGDFEKILIGSNYPIPIEYIQNARDVMMFLKDFCPQHADSGLGSNPTCNPNYVYTKLHYDWETQNCNIDLEQCQDPANGTDVRYMHQLANDMTANHPVHVDILGSSEYIRLRIINPSSMTNWQVQLGNLVELSHLIAVDGQVIKPVRKSNFWIAVSQRLSILIKKPEIGNSPQLYPIFAVEEGNWSPLRSALVLVFHPNDIILPYKKRSYSPQQKEPVGWMGAPDASDAQELLLEAWKGLTNRTVNKRYNILLTGNNGFMGINSHSYQLVPHTTQYIPNPRPLLVKKGWRVCLTIKNLNADAHAMHLHGHSFQITKVNNQKHVGAMRDTVLLARGGCSETEICFDADNPGTWLFHCHMTYHLAAGMLTTVEYVSDDVDIESELNILPLGDDDETGNCIEDARIRAKKETINIIVAICILVIMMVGVGCACKKEKIKNKISNMSTKSANTTSINPTNTMGMYRGKKQPDTESLLDL